MSNDVGGDPTYHMQAQQHGRLSIVATYDQNGVAHLAIENPDGSFSTFEAKTSKNADSPSHSSHTLFRDVSTSHVQSPTFLYFNDDDDNGELDDDDDDDDMLPPPPPPPPQNARPSPLAVDKASINQLLFEAASEQRRTPKSSISPTHSHFSQSSSSPTHTSAYSLPARPNQHQHQPQPQPQHQHSSRYPNDQVIDDLPADYVLPPAPPPPTAPHTMPAPTQLPKQSQSAVHITTTTTKQDSASRDQQPPEQTDPLRTSFGSNRFATRSKSSKMASIMQGLKKTQKPAASEDVSPPKPSLSQGYTSDSNITTAAPVSTIVDSDPVPGQLPPVPPVPPLPVDDPVLVKTVRRPPALKQNKTGYEASIEVHTTTVTSDGTTLIHKKTICGASSLTTHQPDSDSQHHQTHAYATNMTTHHQRQSSQGSGSFSGQYQSYQYSQRVSTDSTTSSTGSIPPPPPPHTPGGLSSFQTSALPPIPPVPELPPSYNGSEGTLPPPPPPPPSSPSGQYGFISPPSSPQSSIPSPPLSTVSSPPPPAPPGVTGGPKGAAFRLGDTSSFFKRPMSANGTPLSPMATGPVLPNPGLSIMPEVTDVNSSQHVRLMTPKPLADLSSVGRLHVHEPGPVKTNVNEVRRVAHFSFDPVTGKFVDVPPEWKMELSKKFGLPLQLSCTMTIDGYPGRIPEAIIMMKSLLIQKGGLKQVGIFRLAPEGNDVQQAKAAIDNGVFVDCDDVNILAHLLKVWYRELPLLLLDYLKNPQLIFTANTPDEVGNVILTHYPEPYLSVFLWLLDLCCDVVEHQSDNKMGYANMAIVFAPNLYKPPELDRGVDAMRICKLYTNFVEKAIMWRHAQPDRPRHIHPQ